MLRPFAACRHPALEQTAEPEPVTDGGLSPEESPPNAECLTGFKGKNTQLKLLILISNRSTDYKPPAMKNWFGFQTSEQIHYIRTDG
nr:hypothetical protein BCU47_23830 [Enterovibrio norvegicus]